VCAPLSPDGKRYASAASAGDVALRVWDAESSKELLKLANEGAVSSCSFSPDGKRLFTAGRDKGGQVWDAETGELLATVAKQPGARSEGQFPPDGKRLVALVSLPGEKETAHAVKAFDARTGEEVLTVSGFTSQPRCVTVSPDGKSLVTGHADKTVRVLDAA